MKRPNPDVRRVPKLTNGRGTIPFKRTYKGVGLIRVASGTKNRATYLKICDTMDQLHNHGNLPTLNAVREGILSPLEVYAKAKAEGVEVVQTTNTSLKLVDSIRTWLASYPKIKQVTRKGYASHLNSFFKSCRDTDTLRDLPKRLQKYQETCASEGKQRHFNHIRSALMAFTKRTLKKRSQLYQEVRDIEVLPVTPKIQNDAVSVADIIALTSDMPGLYAEMVWSMCSSGMRPGEFFQLSDTNWNTSSDRLNVIKHNPGHGNKGFTRMVMLPFPIAKPARGIKQFTREINKARVKRGLTVTPNSFRKCFSHWCAEAGINRARKSAYMGHNNKTISDLYEKHDVEKYLQADAETFRDYVAQMRNPQFVRPSTNSTYATMSKVLGIEIMDIGDLYT